MIDVVMLPEMLEAKLLPQSQVVVLDVLRATSSVVTALAHGAKEVRLLATVEQVAAAVTTAPPPVVTAGERGCVKVPGFDLGNSPTEFRTDRIGGATVLLSTTNGTRAAIAAQEAHTLFLACLLNASATAQALMPDLDSLHTIFVPAGTNGRIAHEDIIGAGAILWSLFAGSYRVDLPFTDTAWLAYNAFSATRGRLGAALRLGQGGINLIENGFEDDIDFCAALDTTPIIVRVEKHPLVARKFQAV